MIKSFTTPNVFSFRTALYTSLVLTLFLTGLLWCFNFFNLLFVLLFWVGAFAAIYLLVQFRTQKYIYSRVNRIYEELDMIEEKTSNPTLVITDMKLLMDQVRNYATKRKIEIETLKGRDAYRKEFLGNVSHELKTPLFTIQGYILTLLDGAMNKPELCKKYLKRASKGVDRLNYIIEDLDLITKLEVGSMTVEYEDFDIVELIQNVFELLEIKAGKKNIALILDRNYQKPILVKAERERIRQVLTNLVVNSIKYGHKDGTTEVSIEDLVGSKIIVRVTDNGEGIKKEFIPRLFERFYRVDKSRSRDEGGSGLGLSIVKHIVEAHNEHIYVDSVYGIGSEFSFTLERSSAFVEPELDNR
ncbi:sensor histidine kinase [Aquimarina agarivorans]|uniref:sensor histidine kinase n=1 Tax=Aquimarina agarivorans TaxID=980584 RepID=UPI000248EDDB|nr:ATP-binding protein [Aquimarina agarivorans]